MTIDVASFRLQYPEFVDPPFTDAIIEAKLMDSQCDFSRGKLSNNACGENIYERIIFTLTAHNLKLWDNRQKGNAVSGGGISSKSVGKVSVSYNRAASNSSQDDFYLQTIYGADYLSLIKKYCVAIITAC